MVCATMKAGADCAFMSKAGCGFNGGSCHPVIEQCEGCQKVAEFSSGKFCVSYPDPSAKWKASRCNFATHIKAEAQTSQKLNPIKASKRAVKRK